MTTHYQIYRTIERFDRLPEIERKIRLTRRERKQARRAWKERGHKLESVRA